jgi:adenylate cyclase
MVEALAAVNKTGERCYEAELYRIKGTLTLQSRASFKQVSDKSQASQDKSKNTSPQHLTPSTQAEVEREAEECFLKAIEIARKQHAKSLELRATMNLVRLRQQQAAQSTSHNTQYATHSRLAEAHRMLSDVYNWFTEGLDTKDLQEAKALLEELRH